MELLQRHESHGLETNHTSFRGKGLEGGTPWALRREIKPEGLAGSMSRGGLGTLSGGSQGQEPLASSLLACMCRRGENLRRGACEACLRESFGEAQYSGGERNPKGETSQLNRCGVVVSRKTP